MRAVARHYGDGGMDFRRERADRKVSGAVSAVCRQRDAKDDRRRSARGRGGRDGLFGDAPPGTHSKLRRTLTEGNDKPLNDLIDSDAISAVMRLRWTAGHHTCLSSREASGPPACSLLQLLAQQMVGVKGKEQLGGIALSGCGTCPAT